MIRMILLMQFFSILTFANCEPGLEAFEKTVYSKVQQDCSRCHDGSKPQAPAFAVKDLKTSYESLLNYMNFSKIEESLLVIRAGNSHCTTEACDEDSGKDMLTKATDWWNQGENQCFRNGKMFTNEVAIPSNLPGPGNKFITLQLSLESINANWKNSFILIDIQNYTERTESSVGAYLMKSPRFAGPLAFAFKDLKVLLNGKYDPIYNAYSVLNKNTQSWKITGSALGSISPALSGHTLLLLKDGLENPKISVSFMELSESTQKECHAFADFQAQVLPQLNTLSCTSCHSQKGQIDNPLALGLKVFNLDRNNQDLCEIATELGNDLTVSASALVSVPTRGDFGHPQLTPTQATKYSQIIKTWIKK